MRALASVMEASPPPSPATAEKEEASMEEEQQSLPANLEEEEPETSQVGKPASEKHQAMAAKTTAPCRRPTRSLTSSVSSLVTVCKQLITMT
ncbi:hypothetical protein NDU88_006295 [Pleurodeles waltl]|uniref:Uncharacterized protein n=1 Tax=Pleurodeles waltl TaxID=8319 RepID=A0AAV7TWF5_PLEWA|nr:hypothetical protein NDU88_006295 [Pleurodeles waltl]